MNEEHKANYYAMIPAYIRYNNQLKFAERLMYGEITALRKDIVLRVIDILPIYMELVKAQYQGGFLI